MTERKALFISSGVEHFLNTESDFKSRLFGCLRQGLIIFIPEEGDSQGRGGLDDDIKDEIITEISRSIIKMESEYKLSEKDRNKQKIFTELGGRVEDLLSLTSSPSSIEGATNTEKLILGQFVTLETVIADDEIKILKLLSLGIAKNQSFIEERDKDQEDGQLFNDVNYFVKFFLEKYHKRQEPRKFQAGTRVGDDFLADLLRFNIKAF